MFCLLVVLVKLSLLAKWLARKIPLRKPNHGEGIISIKPRPKTAYDCAGLLYSFVVLLHDICVLSSPSSFIRLTVVCFNLFILALFICTSADFILFDLIFVSCSIAGTDRHESVGRTGAELDRSGDETGERQDRGTLRRAGRAEHAVFQVDRRVRTASGCPAAGRGKHPDHQRHDSARVLPQDSAGADGPPRIGRPAGGNRARYSAGTRRSVVVADVVGFGAVRRRNSIRRKTAKDRTYVHRLCKCVIGQVTRILPIPKHWVMLNSALYWRIEV